MSQQHNLSNMNNVNNVNGMNPMTSVNSVNGVNGNNVNLGAMGDMNFMLPALPLPNVVSIDFANVMKQENISNNNQNTNNNGHFNLYNNGPSYELQHLQQMQQMQQMQHLQSNNSPETATGDSTNNANNNNNNNNNNTSNTSQNSQDFINSTLNGSTNDNNTNSNNNNSNNSNTGNNNSNTNGNNNNSNNNASNNGTATGNDGLLETQGIIMGMGNVSNVVSNMSTISSNISNMGNVSNVSNVGNMVEEEDDDLENNNADIDDDFDETGMNAPPKKKRKINSGMSLNTSNGGHSSSSNKHKPVKEWRKSTHAQTSEKMKKAIKFLDEFRAEHNNKLPSLRAIMKMMKVGFPKAHEILNSYAAHVQIPKHVLMQDMVVRQERAKEDETPPRSKSRGRRGSNGAASRREGKNTTDSDEESECSSSAAVNQKLKEMIVHILSLTNSINKQEYYEECKKLEDLVKEFEPNYNEYGVNDRLRLAQSYFLLGSMYRERNERNDAYSYVEKALSTFRDCNTQAQSFGYNVNLPDDITAQEANVSSDDIGHFWPQIFEVYILGGHVLLANSQYADAKTMYELARDLARYIDGPYKVTVSEALENLAVVSMYMNDVESSIEYTKQIIEVLSKQNVRQIKIFNAKAYYACCLTLSQDARNIEEGIKVYKEVLNSAERMFGNEDPSTLGFYCYFGLHWVQIKDFNKAQEHIEKVLNVARPLKAFERKVLHDLLNDFIEAVINGNEIHRLQSLFQYQIENASKFNQDPETAPDKRIDIYGLHLIQARSYAKVHEFSKALSIYNHVMRSFDNNTNSQRKNELAAEIQQIQAQQQLAANSAPSPPVLNQFGNVPMSVFGTVGTVGTVNSVGGLSGVPGVSHLPPMPQSLSNSNTNNNGNNGGNNNNNNNGNNGNNNGNNNNGGNNSNNSNDNGLNLSNPQMPLPLPNQMNVNMNGMPPPNVTNNVSNNVNSNNGTNDNNGNDDKTMNDNDTHPSHSHSHSSSSSTNTNGSRSTSDANNSNPGTNGNMHGIPPPHPPPPPPGAPFNYSFQNGN